MVFVTVICLVVAAYFLWEALKDKKNAEAGHLMSTAHRITDTKPASPGSAQYKNTRSSNQTDAQHSSGSATATTTTASTSQSVSTGQPSANDANAANPVGTDSADVGQGVGGKAAAATVGLAGAALSAQSAGAAPSASSHRTDNGHLRFLDGPIGRKDDLTRINGVGPVIEEGLNDIGIFHYHQIANFTSNDIQNVNTELDFPGRIEREDWVEQARKLSSISLEKSALEDTDHRLDQVVTIDRHAPNFTNPDSALTDADYTGVWNTDVLIEIQERLKVLNTRISDAPRMRMTRDEYTAIKSNDDGAFSRERLLEILDRLRELD